MSRLAKCLSLWGQLFRASKLPIVTLLLLTLTESGCQEETMTSINSNDIYYKGYPGTPTPHPGQKILEQEPGFSHPYLPGFDAQIHLKDFLWTGTVSAEEQFMDSPNASASTSQVTTVSPGVYNPPSRHSQPLSNEDENGLLDGNGIGGQGIEYSSTAYYDMPTPEYLIRTIIKNGTDLLKKNGADIYSFKTDMENRLTRTYRLAYSGGRYKRHAHLRSRRSALDSGDKIDLSETETDKNITVRIHNIRSARPEPEIEILYSVYEKDLPVLAVDAVKQVETNIDNDNAVLLLGHSLKVKAEPYLKSTSVSSNSDWLIASVILGIVLSMLLLWLLFLIYRQYWGSKKKHNILVSSTATSKQASPSGPRKNQDFPIQTNYPGDDRDPNRATKRSTTNLQSIGKDRKIGSELAGSAISLSHSHKMDSGSSPTFRGRLTSVESNRDKDSSGNDSPVLADHSSNNTPDLGQKLKGAVRPGKKREKRRRQMRGGSRMDGGPFTTSEEEMSDSAFPAKTPENLKVLDDLLEEEIPIPGDSGRGSSRHPGQPDWAYLPDSPEPDWGEAARAVKQRAELYNQTLRGVVGDSELIPPSPPKREVKSARNPPPNTRDSRLSEAPRPWSAAEPRWNADRMFTSKQKGWEGLASGRKHLHHGQLLPGSTESEEEEGGPPRHVAHCWSEGNSPRRPDGDGGENGTPLIKAIRSELMRFQRRQPTGVTIVNDPDLLNTDSKA